MGTRKARLARIGLVLIGLPAAAGAQSAMTVPLHDPVYDDLVRLEALGVIDGAAAAPRPWSVARVRSLAARAAEGIGSRLGGDDPRREEARRLIHRVRLRFGEEGGGADRARGRVELELGGGSSPGRTIPSNGVGEVDAVVNPLWSNRSGRTFGDRATLGLSGDLALGLGGRWAAAMGVRGSALDESGAGADRSSARVERLYLRGAFGSWALQVGRDAVAWIQADGGGLLLSENGPTLDMIRLSTDRPLGIGPLGVADFAVLAADLGPNQNFPHAKLFGARASIGSPSSLVVGLTILNKQMGQGAPEAETAERIRDLTVLWGLFRGDDLDQFSEKLAGIDFSARLFGHVGLTGEVVVTDFDRDRIGDVMDTGAGYRLGVVLPRLGPDQRHELGITFHRVGAQVYRHGQFRSGLAVDGVLQGSPSGPDSRSATLRYVAHRLDRGIGTVVVELSAESMSVDPHAAILTPKRDVFRSGDLPNETRLRGRLGMSRQLWDHRGGAVLWLGAERVRGFGFVADAERTNGMILLELWRQIGG